MNAGWVKLHRKLLDNEFLANDQTALVLLIKLLLFVRDDGSCTLGRQQIERLFGIKGTTAYKALKRLENEKMVTTSVTGRYTMINILKWHEYQSNGNRSSNRSVTTGEQVGNRSVTLNKNKEYRIKNIDTKVSMSSSKELRPVFYELVKILNFSDKVVFTELRKKKLKSRLKTFSVDELKSSAKSIAEDDFLQGDNDRGKRYGDIDFLLRSDEQVDKYLDRTSNKSLDELIEEIKL